MTGKVKVTGPNALRLSIVVLCGAIGSFILVSSYASTPNNSLEAENGTLSGCSSKVTDTSASNGGAVKFGSCSNNPLALDATGATIPDTNYPIPAGAIFMATNGNDNNSGTQTSPVLTLARAYALVSNGGTIVVRGGVYRDGLTTSLTKTFTLQAYPHEQPWFDGSNVVTGWTSDGSGHWYVDWSTPSFCNGGYYTYPYNSQPTTNTGPCSHYDEGGDGNYAAAADPQMVFEDGSYIHEVTTLAGATGANFFYDQTAKRLYLGFDPSGHTVELTARPLALFIQGGSGGNIIRGIGFRRYATLEYGGAGYGGAVLMGAPNSTFENDVFTRMAGGGLQISNPIGAVVRSSAFAYNGFDGLVSNGHESSGGATDGLLIDSNVFNYNNYEQFGTHCSASCAAAGSKIAHMDGFTVRNNVFENSQAKAHGFWCDEACTNGVMVDNVAHNNGGAGIFYEVSDTGIIASNLSYNNAGYGIKMGSANTEIYNNTLVNNGVGALIYDDARYAGNTKGSQIGPDTINVSFVNNIIYGTGTMVQAWRTSTVIPPNTGPDTFYSHLDYNSYYRQNASQVLYAWKEGPSGGSLTTTNYTSLSSLIAKGWESHGRDATDGSNPFTNLAGGNYVVSSSSPDYHSSTVIPSDVMAALGLTSGTGYSRGAITWPGQ